MATTTTLPRTTTIMEKDILDRNIMSRAEFDRVKARILASKTLTESNDPARNLQKMALECIEDVRERMAYIKERRGQRLLDEEQKVSSFRSALAERNAYKETEKSTKTGQKAHRRRIEVWRDEVKKQTVVDKNIASGTTATTTTSQTSKKRALDNNTSSPFDKVSAATPLNKRFKLALEDSSSAAQPTSSKKSVPWLSTRASMDDEDVFADDHVRHPEYENIPRIKNDDEADEEIDDENLESEDSYLTQQEQLLVVEMAMVAAMQSILPQLYEKTRLSRWDNQDDY
ncbi:hypothetical protein D6D01_03409 [Aureobasidium pullulans]|uniref:Uncharacterized protein n=1 Tax=Aureobasidium pullulans TaxID=5580 RepID=A0A4S9LKH3_AURPU|nr:hypothetical protein D6D01_03409 [Aureobasidium pullulans]